MRGIHLDSVIIIINIIHIPFKCFFDTESEVTFIEEFFCRDQMFT